MLPAAEFFKDDFLEREDFGDLDLDLLPLLFSSLIGLLDPDLREPADFLDSWEREVEFLLAT